MLAVRIASIVNKLALSMDNILPFYIINCMEEKEKTERKKTETVVFEVILDTSDLSSLEPDEMEDLEDEELDCDF